MTPRIPLWPIALLIVAAATTATAAAETASPPASRSTPPAATLSTSAPRAPAAGPDREPPPQAYVDCRGRKAGTVVAHGTPEGVVDAECVESTKGMVARPMRPPPASSPASATK